MLNKSSLPSCSWSQSEEQKNQNNLFHNMTEEKPPGLDVKNLYGHIALDPHFMLQKIGWNLEPEELYPNKEVSHENNTSNSNSQDKLILDMIIQNKINYADILQRTAGKTKKTIDTIKSKGPNLKVFEYFYDRKAIGCGEGKTSKEAKNASAKQAIEKLITNEKYSVERNEIMIMVFEECHKRNNSQERSQYLNNSELYELNFIARQYSIDPKWEPVSWNLACQKFQTTVKLPEMTVSGQGSSKKSAQQEAAANLIALIKKDKELYKKYYN